MLLFLWCQFITILIIPKILFANCISLILTGVIENITEFRPELCHEVAKQGFIQWILKRLRVCITCNWVKLLPLYLEEKYLR